MSLDLSYAEFAAIGVQWYRSHGMYLSQRIKRDAGGVEYVIGDQSWNRLNASSQEWIDKTLNDARNAAVTKRQEPPDA